MTRPCSRSGGVQRQQGFSLLEVIAAILLLAVTFTALMKVAGSAINLTQTGSNNTFGITQAGATNTIAVTQLDIAKAFSAALAVTVLAFMIMGDVLRDALDPTSPARRP